MLRRLFSLFFWVSLIYYILFSQLAFLQNWVNTSQVGVVFHTLIGVLFVIGLLSYLLRIIHYHFVK